MSVVIRTMQGRQYIHVRRKINKQQKQKFYSIDGLDNKEVAILKHQANALDKEWQDQQGNESSIGLLLHNGKPAHIRITSPTKREGWAIVVLKHNTAHYPMISCSRSIDKYGFKLAFDTVFSCLINGLGLKPRSITAKVGRAIFYSHFSYQYQTMRLAHNE